MLRRLHSIPALVAALVICFMALTGAVLSLQPAIAQWQAGSVNSSGVDVSRVASAVSVQLPSVTRIVRNASGAVIAYFDANAGQVADYVDPRTGAVIGPYEPSSFFSFMIELHRSLFLGQSGHAVAGVGAAAMLILSVSGALLLVARLGGWSRIFSTARGAPGQRLHVDIGRIALLTLLLIGLTGTYMSLVSFGLVGSGEDGFGAFPSNVDGGKPASISSLAALQSQPLENLRELVFPAQGDPTDVFTLTTSQGIGYVDQATGQMLSFTPNSLGQTIYEAFYTLHTGQGIWWLALLLGATALCVPVMAISGTLIWWRRRASLPRIVGNESAHAAETIILVGSESNSTWGFASALHNELRRAGHRVHTGTMNSLAAHYPHARQMFILTATYGDGAAPASANRFLERLSKLGAPAVPRFAVLGFGDRSFSHYCQFAQDVETALRQRGWTPLLPHSTIDKQSSQSFAQWGERIGRAIDAPLALTHISTRPKTQDLVLFERIDYGIDVQAATAVLRFRAPQPARRGPFGLFGGRARLPRFEAGDLVGILPPGSTVPRYYSLASASRDGVLEICVRKQSGGLCSQFLHALEPGGRVEAFIRRNPDFRPIAGRAPVIMIGAGTGIAPLAGFIRHNTRHKPIHLYWGGRDPRSDFLYEDVLAQAVKDRHLTRVVTAFSRIAGGQYVQDKVRSDAETLRQLVRAGAQIIVCGGREMAEGVRQAIDEALTPIGVTAIALKAKGKYLEDVY